MGVLKDFVCPACETTVELIVAPKEKVYCAECETELVFDWCTPLKYLTTIVPSRPGSKKHAAGYVHTHADRPAEKVQGVGWSPDKE